ncbi:transcriptional regulator, XRE family [Rhodospirillum rubrum ATCC 11170]|uniref:Transcriptional regulator, XRE family n=2 Tax=Rhodospirillum rubrum TaxID=1085 RepID=Q2RPA8_RHORT|nr:transcriptional regulator, XRE family [Rhodospirillum rubrum ATCC 11170]MBK5955721.1 transcriptional regulator [Rhodospirillum rubrum]HAP99271.1 XRE family transcriptional regulator [Rhodospirillum rubrum]HCF18361.1 XRE family transcriptional regulator [Rhodospirillum rubrum]
MNGRETMPESDTRTIHHVDAHVGQRVRQRRTALILDQETLARRIGVSFQQIQKYERGRNRISASRLYDIAKALAVPIDYFFSDLERGDPRHDGALAEDMGRLAQGGSAPPDPLRLTQSLDLAQAFWALPDDGMRQSFIALLKAMSSFED